MNREQALQSYKKKVSDKLIKEYEEKVQDNFVANEEKIKYIIIEAIKNIIKKAEHNQEINKDYRLSVFQFELLRINILDESYKIFIHGYNSLWYLDDNSIYEYVDLKFLFEPFIELKKKLIQEKKIYIGKVNNYDIEQIIFEITVKFFNSMSESVRVWLWDLDEKEWINNPIVNNFYIVKWSEYLADSETVFAMDSKEKTINDLLELKNKPKDNGPFVYTVWKNSNLEGGKFEEDNMLFINFKGSNLKRMDFLKTNMLRAQLKSSTIYRCKFQEVILSGAIFQDSNITDCDFENSDLRSADFTNACLNNICFKNTNLQDAYFVGTEFKNIHLDEAIVDGAIFKAEDIPFLHLTSNQLQTIFIEGEEV